MIPDTSSAMVPMPLAGIRRALFIIDVQPATLTSDSAHETLERLRAYVRAAPYDAYVIATFHAPVGSMFERQLNWTLSQDAAGPSDSMITASIAASGLPAFTLHKTARSIFKTDGDEALGQFLRLHGIDELHLAGFDINDCVLASAYDALDRGYFSFVLEECSGRTDGSAAVIDAALTVLRKQGMTNRSTRPDLAAQRIDLHLGN